MDFKVINKFALRRWKVDFSIGKTQDERGNEPRKSIEEHVLRIPVVQFLRKSVHLRPFRENRIANVTLGNEGRRQVQAITYIARETAGRRFYAKNHLLLFKTGFLLCRLTASPRPPFVLPSFFPRRFSTTRAEKTYATITTRDYLSYSQTTYACVGISLFCICDIARARFCAGAAERQAIILSHLLIFSLRAEEEARFIFVTENKWYTIKINASFFLLISGKR